MLICTIQYNNIYMTGAAIAVSFIATASAVIIVYKYGWFLSSRIHCVYESVPKCLYVAYNIITLI